jgi:hypothetical protein
MVSVSDRSKIAATVLATAGSAHGVGMVAVQEMRLAFVVQRTVVPALSQRRKSYNSVAMVSVIPGKAVPPVLRTAVSVYRKMQVSSSVG